MSIKKTKIFFNSKPTSLKSLFPNHKIKRNIKINVVKPLISAGKNDLTFYDSKKYKHLAESTKASFCITTVNLSHDLPIFTFFPIKTLLPNFTEINFFLTGGLNVKSG